MTKLTEEKLPLESDFTASNEIKNIVGINSRTTQMSSETGFWTF